MQVAELTAERNYAVASKQQAAEAAAALEAEAATLLDQKKQAVTTLQSQISQLKVHSSPLWIMSFLLLGSGCAQQLMKAFVELNQLPFCVQVSGQIQVTIRRPHACQIRSCNMIHVPLS